MTEAPEGHEAVGAAVYDVNGRLNFPNRHKLNLSMEKDVFKDADLEVLKTLDKSAVSYQVVLTKADQVKPAELQAQIDATMAALSKHPAAFPEVLATSSRSGAGMAELRAAMVRLLGERG